MICSKIASPKNLLWGLFLLDTRSLLDELRLFGEERYNIVRCEKARRLSGIVVEGEHALLQNLVARLAGSGFSGRQLTPLAHGQMLDVVFEHEVDAIDDGEVRRSNNQFVAHNLRKFRLL